MFNRRFLRIKVFQSLYALSREEQPNTAFYRKKLLSDLDKTYELLVFVLSFPEAFLQFLESELESQKAKYIPTEYQIVLLEKIKGNAVMQLMGTNAGLKEAQKKHKVIWNNSSDMLRGFWNEIKESTWLQQYASLSESNFNKDKEFISTLFEMIIADEDIFYTYFEERYFNYEDDQVLILTTTQKLLKDLKPGNTSFLPSPHKEEEEDIRFLKELFETYVAHEAELSDLISSRTKNWDEERIALVDMILMRMALCEMMYFPQIPVKVSINEYLELAKLYSTPNSHGFINGILDKTQFELKKLNRIVKEGRGLVE